MFRKLFKLISLDKFHMVTKEDLIRLLQKDNPAEKFRDGFQAGINGRVAIIESDEFNEPITSHNIECMVMRVLKIRAQTPVPLHENYLTVQQNIFYKFDGQISFETICSLGSDRYAEPIARTNLN